MNGENIEFDPEPNPVIGKANNSLEVSLYVGGGIQFALGPGAFLLEARYGIGLTNFVRKHKMVLIDNKIEGQPDTPLYLPMSADEKSRTFILSLGYAIPLK